MYLPNHTPHPTEEDLAQSREGRLSPAQEAAARKWLSLQGEASSKLVRDALPSTRWERLIALVGAGLLIAGAAALLGGIPAERVAIGGLVAMIFGTITGISVAVVYSVGRFLWGLVKPDPDRAERAALTADLRTGNVEILAGRIEFGGTGYVCRAGARTFLTLPAQVLTLPISPGNYHLQVLPTSGLVVGLDPIPRRPIDAPTTALARVDEVALCRALMIANQLDEGALAANRLGRLAPGQLRAPAIDLLVASFVTLPIPAFFWCMFNAGPDGSSIVGDIVVGAFTALLAALIGWGLTALVRDARGGVVMAAAGPMQVTRLASGTISYEVGGKSFQITPRGIAALIPGVHHRVWYTPHAEVMVGIEPCHPAREDLTSPQPP